MLQLGDVLGRPGVLLAAQAILVDPADIEHPVIDRVVAISLPVPPQRFLGDLGKADAFDGGGGAGEELLGEGAREAHRVEDLRAAIGLVGRDAHLGHDLADALAHALDEVGAHLFGREIRVTLGTQGFDRLEGEIGVDRFRAVAGQHAEVMHLARFAGFDHEAGLHSEALAHQMVMHRRGGEQRGHRHARLALRSV